MFIRIACSIIDNFPSAKPSMLSELIKGRKLLIFGNDREAVNAFINLKIGGENPAGFIHQVYENVMVGGTSVENWKKIIGKKDEYFIVAADQKIYALIRKLLILAGYEPNIDFVQYKPVSYEKRWFE